MSSRAALTEGPILRTMLRLASANLFSVIAVAVLVGTDAVVLGRLDRSELAGVSIVFPLVMLMQNMAAGGFGTAVGSLVAQAVGAREFERARAITIHAFLAVLSAAVLCSIAGLLLGPVLYRASDAPAETLEAALSYSRVVFSGAVAIWLFNVTASIVRGYGAMMFAGVVSVATAVVYVVLCIALVLGSPQISTQGAARAGLALVFAYTVGIPPLIWFALRQRSSADGFAFRLRFSMVLQLLTLGSAASINAILNNVTLFMLGIQIAHLGPAAVSGYGLASRLEYLVIPIVFSIGSALATIVGANIGARAYNRASRATWIGAQLAVGVAGAVGMVAAITPSTWLTLFSDDREVLAAGATYLRLVGPAYMLGGLGTALYFAALGAGKPFWPLTAGGARLAVVVLGGWIGSETLLGVGMAAAAGLAAYCVCAVLTVRIGTWR